MSGDLKFPEKFSLGHGHLADAGGGPCRQRVDGLCRGGRRALPRGVRSLSSLRGGRGLDGKLGVNAYRMGIEWSRLQSAPFAPLNQKELARYSTSARLPEGCEYHADGRAASFFQSAVDFGGWRLAESARRSRRSWITSQNFQRP
jgi:hypothetical protein